MIKKLIASLCVVSATVFATPIPIIVGSTPGGATDAVARKFEEFLEKKKVSASITNIGGAGGKLAVVSLYNKPNTVGFISNSLFLHYADESVDPTKVEVVSIVAETPYYIVSKLPNSKVCKSSQKLLLGAGAGGITGFIASRMSQQTPTIITVPYKGVRESVFDVAKGEVDMAIVARKSDILTGQNLKIVANTSNKAVNGVPSANECFGVKINTLGQFIVIVPTTSTPEFKKSIKQYVDEFVSDTSVKQFYKESNLHYVNRTYNETLQFVTNETLSFRNN